jgi:hypothetical protein
MLPETRDRADLTRLSSYRKGAKYSPLAYRGEKSYYAAVALGYRGHGNEQTL